MDKDELEDLAARLERAEDRATLLHTALSRIARNGFQEGYEWIWETAMEALAESRKLMED